MREILQVIYWLLSYVFFILGMGMIRMDCPVWMILGYAVLLGIFGYWLGPKLEQYFKKLPSLFMIWYSNQALVDMFIERRFWHPEGKSAELIFDELKARGQNIKRFLPEIFDLIESGDINMRTNGWEAFFKVCPGYQTELKGNLAWKEDSDYDSKVEDLREQLC